MPDVQVLDQFPGPPGALFALGQERQIGDAGVLAGEGPFGLAVPDEHDVVVREVLAVGLLGHPLYASGMTNHRSVSITRTAAGHFTATNARGGTLDFGDASDDLFSPVELLLTAIAGCSAIDVDIFTTRRAEPTGFDVVAEGDKLRDEQGNHMGPIDVTFTVRFPEGEAGDAARTELPDAVRRSHERLCTVSRTVLLPTEVTMHVD